MCDPATGIMNDQNDILFEGGESKSSSSQESGLCSTMLAVDESLGSLEELSENLHQNLDSHIDHTSMLHYELDLLRSQLTEKNRLIATQQVTIKQLQDALNSIQKESGEIKKRSDLEIACKSETIDILQSDLIECQQQYANCLEKVMNQNRLLSEIQEDDALLVRKISQLESKLTKKNQTVATQTTLKFELHSDGNYRQSSQNFKTLSSPILSSSHREVFGNNRPRIFCDGMPSNREGRSSPQFGCDVGRHSSPLHNYGEVPWSPQFQDLLTEIRQIQKLLQSTKEEQVRPSVSPPNRNHVLRSDDLAEFWNTITEERQHRVELNHLIRSLELDVLEVKTQIQSCKIRLDQPPSQHQSYACQSPKLCSAGARQEMNSTSSRTYPVLPYPKARPKDTIFTLV